MSGSSLTVKISADVTSLQAQSAVAKAELAQLNSTVKSLATQFVGASDEMKGSLAPQLEAATAKAAQTKSAIGDLTAQMKALSTETAAVAEHTEAVGILGKLGESARITGDSFENLHARLSVFSEAASAFSEFILAGLGIEQVAESVKNVAENGADLLHLSEATGITTESLSGLKLATQEAGGSFDTISSAVMRLANNMQSSLRDKTGAAAEAFHALGLSATDSQDNLVPLDTMLDEITQKLSGFADGTNKTAIELGLFGIRGADLIPVLNQLQGDGGMAGAAQKAAALGDSVSEASAAFDEQFMIALADSKAALFGVENTIDQGLIPGFTALIDGSQQAGAGTVVLNVAEVALEATLKGVVGTVAIFIDSLKAVVAVAYDVGEELGVLVKSLEATGDAMILNFKAAAAEAQQASQLQIDASHQMMTSVVGDYQNVIDVIDALKNTETTMPEMPKLTLPDAPVIDTGANKAAEAAKQAAQQETEASADASEEQTQIAQLQYQKQVDIWDAEVTQNKMTKVQELQDEISAKDQQYASDLDALQKKAALYAQGTAAKAKALDDETVLELQHNDDILKLDADLLAAQKQQTDQMQQAMKTYTDQVQKDFESAFAPIDHAFDTTINGIIQGTTTLQAGVEHALGSIILASIDAAEKMLTSWAAAELGKLAATANTQAGIVAINAQGKAVAAATSLSQVANSAHVAAAGAYSAVAGIPFVGPVLAPAAAAAAYAGVMAFDVISAEGGAANIAADGTMAILHQNEMVLPASIASPLRDQLASSSSSNTENNGGSMSITYAPQISIAAGGAANIDSTLAQSAQQMYSYIQQNYFRNGALTLPGR